jgi:hypothetical protein
VLFDRVLLQYMGALLFGCVIYRQRHKFGIPEALACAEDRFYEQRQLSRPPGATSTGGSSTLVAKKLASSRSGIRSASAEPGSSGKTMSPHKRQQHHAGRAKRHSRTSSADPSPRRGASPRRSRESSGTLRIDLTAFEQQLAQENGDYGTDSNISPGCVSPARRRSNRYSTAGDPTAATFGGQVDVLTSSFSGHITHRHHPNQSQQEWSTEPVSALAQHAPAGPLNSHQQQLLQQGGLHNNPSRLATAAAAAAAGVGQHPDNSSAGNSVDASDRLRHHHDHHQQQQQQHGAGRSSGGGMYQLHRWDSAGSESKLPRYLAGGPSSSWGQLLLLLRSLDWVGFVRRFAGMTTRGMLILSTYTTATLVAAKGGTATMAAHQVGCRLLSLLHGCHREEPGLHNSKRGT